MKVLVEGHNHNLGSTTIFDEEIIQAITEEDGKPSYKLNTLYPEKIKNRWKHNN